MYKAYRLFGIFLLFSAVVYSQTEVQVNGELPDSVSETSGLLFYGERLITHNDSGNEARLYELDTTSLAVVRQVTVANATNVDWEDIAQDDTHIFVGDFGNSKGVRTDLVIYRIAKEDYDTSDVVNADAIRFSYEDQEVFVDNGNSDWDAEALVVWQDQLLVFTKQWVSRETSVYAIPKNPGTHKAKFMAKYDVRGLITGATGNTETDGIYLTGYSELLFPFLVKLVDFEGADVSNATMERMELAVGPAQIEAIAHVSGGAYLLSSESVRLSFPPLSLAAQVFSFKVQDSTTSGETGNDTGNGGQGANDGLPPDSNRGNKLKLFKESGSDQLGFRLMEQKPLLGYAIFDTTGRRVQFGTREEISDSFIDVSTLESSLYYLSLYLEGENQDGAFFRD